MSVYVTNGFKAACFTDNFFGKVNEIEVDNVYDNTIFYRAINEINEKKIEHYKSNDYDLSILKHCPTIKYISISGEATLNDLIGLENIRGIKIGLPIGDNESFDFCRLPHVNMLAIHADGKNRTWMKMDWLKKLYIHEYLNSDLKAFSIRGLEELTLDMSRIKTLDGIENFPSLRYFAADYCKKLKSIKELACLKSLETLKISDCTLRFSLNLSKGSASIDMLYITNERYEYESNNNLLDRKKVYQGIEISYLYIYSSYRLSVNAYLENDGQKIIIEYQQRSMEDSEEPFWTFMNEFITVK